MPLGGGDVKTQYLWKHASHSMHAFGRQLQLPLPLLCTIPQLQKP